MSAWNYIAHANIFIQNCGRPDDGGSWRKWKSELLLIEMACHSNIEIFSWDVQCLQNPAQNRLHAYLNKVSSDRFWTSLWNPQFIWAGFCSVMFTSIAWSFRSLLTFSSFLKLRWHRISRLSILNNAYPININLFSKRTLLPHKKPKAFKIHWAQEFNIFPLFMSFPYRRQTIII